MKQIAAAAITLVLLAAALWFGRRPPPPKGAVPAATPAGCIERMFAAAEQGDVETYLDCFTGPQRERLERELGSQTREAYARSLAESIRELKGRAVFDAPSENPPSREATVTVERVYVHRLECQTYHLVAQSGEWRIDNLQTPSALQPEKAYGQPVFDLAPPVSVQSSGNKP
jgi:hypothetical protein